MPILTLREHLIVDYPGEALGMLQTLATFEREGRLRGNQKRLVPYWKLAENGQRLYLPRGLFRTVRRILPNASVVDQRLRFHPLDLGFRASLRDYQEAIVQALYDREGGVMVMPPSAGKTRSALALAARWQQPTLFLVHTLRLADKTVADARSLLTLPRKGLGLIAEGRETIGTHFTVATVQTLASKPRLIKKLVGRVGTVIVDECVVGDTLVDGVPIRDRKVGDMVTAYDPATDTFSLKPITRTFRRTAPDELIHVVSHDHALVCTRNHPIWVQREKDEPRWIDAQDLLTGDMALDGDGHWIRVNFLWIYDRGTPEFDRVCPDGQVYNLEVADPHTFLAGGIATHNCHHSPADSFQKVLNSFPAYFRGGLSATPAREDGLGPMVYATLGAPVRVNRDYLSAQGYIVDPTIYLVPTNWSPPEEVPFSVAEEARAMDSGRNGLIARVVWNARRQGQRVLILVEREKHALILAQLLSQGGVSAYPVMGRLPKPLQDERFKWMEQGKAVVVATKLANEGLDWPTLDCVVLAAPGRSETILEQRTGRAARPAPGKTGAIVYDFVDDGAMYRDQTTARIEKYHEMGYRIRRFTWPTK